MQFDNFTLVATSLAAILTLGVLSGILWLRERDAAWLSCWGLAFIVSSGGVVVRALAESEAEQTLMILSTAFVINGLGLVWQTARIFEGKQFSAAMLVTATGLWLSGQAWPAFVESLQVRVVIASLFGAGFLGLAAYELWQGRAERLMSRMPAVWLLSSGAGFLLARAAFAGLLPFPLGGLPTHPMGTAVMNLVLFIHAVGLTVLFVSLSRERTEGRQRRFAQTDVLTGLMNRRAFTEQGVRLLRRCKLSQQPVALLALDIDRFKSINDRFGHTAGDRVLEHFAALLRETMRLSDGVFRTGGEEFCCILPDVDAAQAWSIADRLCHLLRTSPIQTETAALFVTVSIGIAVSGQVGYDLNALLMQADTALYAAKSAGRDQAVYCPEVAGVAA